MRRWRTTEHENSRLSRNSFTFSTHSGSFHSSAFVGTNPENTASFCIARRSEEISAIASGRLSRSGLSGSVRRIHIDKYGAYQASDDLRKMPSRWSQDSVPLLVDEDLIFNRRNAFIHNDKTLVPDRVHPQLRGEKIWRTLYLPVLTFTQHWSSKTKHISPKVFPWKKPGITSVRHVEQEWVPGGT